METTHTVLALTTDKPHEVRFLCGSEWIFSRSTTFVSPRIPVSETRKLYVLTFRVSPKGRRYLVSLADADDVLYEGRMPEAAEEFLKGLTEEERHQHIAPFGVFLFSFADRLRDEGIAAERLFGDASRLRVMAPSLLLESLYGINAALASKVLFNIILKDAPEQSARFWELYKTAIKLGRVKNDHRIARAKAAASSSTTTAEVPTEASTEERAETSAEEPAEEPVEEPTEAADVVKPDAMENGEFVWIDGILVSRSDLVIFETMRRLPPTETANILMVGPSGCGKTSIPIAFAKYAGMDVLRMNCAAVRDPEEWYGYREAVNGSTVFVPSEFTKKVRQGNTVIILDEFNRVEPWLHNTLLPLLDHDRRTIVHGEEIVCGPHTIFVATMNVGARFTGTFVLDTALLNRFDAVINVSYLPFDAEVKVLTDHTGVDKALAKKIVHLVTRLREHSSVIEYGLDVSTRTALKVAKIVAYGGIDIRTAFGYVVLNVVDDAALLKSLNDLLISALDDMETL